jgi:hypothetical protein
MINPIDNPGQIAAERDVIALWSDDRVRAVREHVGRLWKHGWGDSAPEEVVPLLEESIDEYLTNWLFKAAASDSQHPRFVRNFMPAYSWHGHDVPGARTGGDNPDNVYRLAGISHGTAYRVTGRIVGREPANVSFTLVGDYGTSVTIQTIENHEIVRASDGSFVITIDDQPAGGRSNHMTTAPHVKFLYVRDSMEDWAGETPFDLHIERLGSPKAEPLTRDEMAQRAILRAREDVPLYFWFQCSLTNIKPNSFRAVATNRGTGGLVTQGLAKGCFVLNEDDAVIVEYEPGGANYVSIQLSNWILRSLDSERITSSLTRAQSQVSSDGRVRAVIARRDPGVANWLDCGGFQTITMMHRWQGLPATPVRGGPHVDLRMGKLGELRSALPPDTIWVTPEERAAQIAARQAAYARRFLINQPHRQ